MKTKAEKLAQKIKSDSEESNYYKVSWSIGEKVDESDGRLHPLETFLIGKAILDAYAPQQEYFGETDDGLTTVN